MFESFLKWLFAYLPKLIWGAIPLNAHEQKIYNVSTRCLAILDELEPLDALEAVEHIMSTCIYSSTNQGDEREVLKGMVRDIEMYLDHYEKSGMKDNVTYLECYH